MLVARTVLKAIVAVMVLAAAHTAWAQPFAYIANVSSDNVSVIDTATNTLVTNVNVGSSPRSVTVNFTGIRAYVANSGSNNVSVIDTSTNTVITTVPVGSAPTGIAVNRNGTRAYVANSGGSTVSILDTGTNSVIANVTVGTNPSDVAINPAGTRAYVANLNSANVSVIDLGTNTVLTTIGVGIAPRGIAVNPIGTRVYVANSSGSTVSVLDTTTNTLSGSVTVTGFPQGVTFNPSGTRAYVSSSATNIVSVINTATDAVIATVNVGAGPIGIAGNPAGTRVYVANSGSDNVSVIDTASNTVISTVAVGMFPDSGGKFIVPSATPPGPPTMVSAVPGNGSATVSFMPPPYDGGAPITGYRVTSVPGGFSVTGPSSPIIVNGLTNGISYSFTVFATNSIGNGSAVTSNSVTPNVPNITANLQARYACDGNALDSTANARHLATDFGVATFTANARSGSACSFNGATRLKSVTPFAFSWPVTYAFWINDASPTSQEILMQAASFGTTNNTQNVVATEVGSILRIFGNNSTAPFSYREVSPSGVLDSTWHHVAITATRFRDTIQIYVDGALATTATTGINANFDLDGSFFLGSRSDLISTSPQNFSGKLDEVRLYDRVLSPVDIAELVAPPGITKVADSIINEDGSANNLPFTVNDLQTPAAALTLTSSSSNTALLPNANVVLGGTGANRTVSLTPNPDTSGTSTITLTVTDGNAFTDTQSFVLTVDPVNDAPSFGVGAAISPLFEDPGPQSVPGWAIALDDGDPETVQTLNFVVTPISGTLNFSAFPTVSPTGTLSYTPAPDSFGSAMFSVRLDDDGGTANGGVNQSALQNFTINVGPVNDAPSFVVGANQNVLEDAGAISLPGWAGALDDGDPETVQTLNFVVTPISGTVNFSVFPTVSPTGTLSYTTDTDSVGSATFSVRLDDDGGTLNGGVNQSALQNFTVNVGPVNDAPSFAVGAAISPHFEDPGPQSVPGWAIALDDGDPETVQTLNFVVTPISGTLNFSAFPTVSPTGTLSYTPAPDSFGSAMFSVRLDDDGGTANGGVNQSALQNFTINVGPVNDAPSFNVGANQNILEDAGAISLPNWATALDDGDPESVQNLNFTLISNSNPTLFAVAPTISPTGTLSFTSVANASGSATISLRLDDDGGSANGGVNQSAPQNFTITVAPVNDLPSFVVGTNQILPPGSNAPQTISNWASAISDGDLDFMQSLTFNVTNDRNSMFTTQPTVAANGTLSFTPNGTVGRAIISVSLTDDASAGGAALSTPVQTFSIIVRGIPTVTIEQRSPAATVVGEPFSVRVRVLNPSSSFQASGLITVSLLPSGDPVQCTLAPIATPPGAAEAICNNVISPIATAKLVQASYNGDAVFELGEGLSQHPVDKAATRLTILEDLPDPSMSNSPVAVRYSLEVLPPSLSTPASLTGTITLSDGQSETSAPFTPSNPITSITLQGNGARVLTAIYRADGNFLDSSDTEDHQLIGGNNTDLAVEISNRRRFVPVAGTTSYDVRVRNLGSVSSNAQLDAFVPPGLDNYRWTCSASAGSSCHAPSGNGTIVAGINILAGGQVTYSILADVLAAEATTVSNSVSITPSTSPPDSNPINDVATDTDVVAVYLDGFED